MGRVTGITRKIRWYIGALMGDGHYRRYLDYRNRAHPGEPVLSEAEYWRMRHSMAETGVTPHCC